MSLFCNHYFELFFSFLVNLTKALLKIVQFISIHSCPFKNVSSLNLIDYFSANVSQVVEKTNVNPQMKTYRPLANNSLSKTRYRKC